jgi:hypothetical protein
VLNIDPAAATGARNVTVTTAAETVSLAGAFTVQPGAVIPMITSLTPNTAAQGQAVQVTITGQNTHFQQGVTMANFGPGVSTGAAAVGTLGPVQVTNPTTAIAQVAVPASAVTGSRTVVVQTGSEQASLFNGFFVKGTPYLSSVSPSTGQKGQTLSVTIQANFTNFQQGVTQATFGPGISVGGAAQGAAGPVTVTGPMTATAQLVIDPAAAPGLRSPVVQTGAEQASLCCSGFLVLGPVTGPPPTVSFTGLTEGMEITAPTPITGTINSPNLASWSLAYQGSGSTFFTTFAQGTTANVSGTFDPTLLLNGIAQIQLTAVDQSGQTTSTTVNVEVTRNLKIGNFTLSFNDLTIPVAGIPIQVIRTYDSRNKSSGDFGFGWSLDIKTIKVDANGKIGDNWAGTIINGFAPNFCIQAAQNHIVNVRLQDGTTYQFAPTVTQDTRCAQFAPPISVDLAFIPVGATPPNASLTAANASNLTVFGQTFPGPIMLLDPIGGNSFTPDQFILTMPDGRQITISRTFGVQSIKDRNANMLTITANGIISDKGTGVSFRT